MKKLHLEKQGGLAGTRRVQFGTRSWLEERRSRLIRICRCMDRGRAAGKRIGRMSRLHAWRWKGKFYVSDPCRQIRFSRVTIERVYRAWRRAGRDAAPLAPEYRAPLKIGRWGLIEYARICVSHPDVHTLAGAHARLPRPRATWRAYRLSLGLKAKGRIARLFAARRALAVRTREARAALNELVSGGVK